LKQIDKKNLNGNVLKNVKRHEKLKDENENLKFSRMMLIACFAVDVTYVHETLKRFVVLYNLESGILAILSWYIFGPFTRERR
jgi:hypothetical protein